MFKYLAKYLLISIILVFILLSALNIYINHLYLSKDGKTLAQKQLEDILGTRVFFKNISYDLFNGIVFRNLIVTDPADDKKIIFFAEKAEMRLILADILKGKYIIQRLTLSSPELFIRRNREGIVNLSGFKTNTAPGIIPNIHIKDGKIHYEDSFRGKNRNFSLLNSKGVIAPSIKGVVNFELSGTARKGKYRNIMLVGNYNIFSDKLLVKILGKKIDAAGFNDYIKDFSGIDIRKGNAKINFRVETVSFLKPDIFGKYELEGVEAENENFLLSGNCNGILKTSDKSGGGKLIGRISLEDCAATDKKKGLRIENIRGDFFFNAGGFLSKNISFDFLRQSFNAEVTAADFKKPFYSINIKTTFKDNWDSSPLFGNYAKDESIKISGQAELMLNYRGYIEDISPENLSGIMELNGVNVNCRYIGKEIRNVTGKIHYDKNVFSSESLMGKIEREFKFKGSLSMEDTKKLKFEADYSGKKFEGNIALTENTISIRPLKIQMANSDLTLNGILTDLKSPSYNLSVEGNIDVRDILALDKLKDYALPVKSSNKILIKGKARGEKPKISDPTLEVDFSSDAITYRTMDLEKISGRLKYAPGKALMEFSAENVCSGKLEGNIILLSKNGPPAHFSLETRIKDMDLERFSGAILDKKQNVRGKTDFHIKLGGTTGKTETFKGKGVLKITDGRLWDMQLFDGIWQILVINNPDLKKAVFTEAEMDFEIKNKKILISNAVFSSEHFLLMPRGSVGFDKQIDFWVESGFFEDSRDSGPEILAKRIGNIKCRMTTIHATGSIDKPVLKTEMKPLGEIFR
ncbi:MAG: AsmA-like C-terminal region-containing protein [bacterium]|nr:AsmA-like C-terminal region-containing protein [bacterium]